MPDSKKEITVNLPEVDFRYLTVKLVGETQLVTCPFSVKQMQQIEDKVTGKAKTQKHDIRNPWEDFIYALYWLTPPPKDFTEQAFKTAIDKGARFGIHVGAIKDSAIMAAYRRGLVKNAVTARGLFQITGTVQDWFYEKSCIEIITSEPPKMRKDCLSTFSSGADMRYRPQFNKWALEFTVKYDNGTISPEQLLMWFQLGGFACGLGENRAEKGEGWGSYILG